MNAIGIDTEWGRLRRAVVGRPDLAQLLVAEGVDVEAVAGVAPIVIGRRTIPATPRPLGEVDGTYLEAGDVVRNGAQIYVGMSGLSSNMAGIDALEARLGPHYRVIPIALRSSVRHLEDVLALPRPGLLVQCPTLLIDGLPGALRDWERIDLTPGEGARRAADVMVIDEGRIVVAAEEVRLGDELRRRGLKVFPIALGGGLRLAHAALWRA